jgi:phosphoserine phosphatase RsbU/P
VKAPGGLDEDTAEALFEEAPCGYLATTPDGTIVRVNRTFEDLAGRTRDELVGRRRFQELLSPGGRIYHETHCAPLLRMQGAIREIALEIVRADGSRRPVLVNSVMRYDDDGRPAGVRTMVLEAVDRRRYEEELLRAREQQHEVAVLLERSLLAGELPAHDRFALGVTYRPAVRGDEVGGDWYDAFRLDDADGLGVVVGDVVGRGISAAATMGQLRSAVRAFTSTGMGPAAAMDALDAYSRRHAVGDCATVVHAQVDLARDTMRYVCAGHPPPVLVDPGRAPRFLWEGRSLPLNANPGGPARAEGECGLVPGATLLLSTDGLVERRDRSLDEGMQALIDAMADLRDLQPAELTEALTDGLGRRGGMTDDVCVLALRRTGG